MKIALFTNQFPGPISTFFSRDVINLLEHGIEVDIYTLYKVDNKNWSFVPVAYRDVIRGNIELTFLNPFKANLKLFSKIKGDIKKILSDSISYGFRQVLKSTLTIFQALGFSEAKYINYDAIICYWGNYSGTCGYLVSRLYKKQLPYFIFLHAGIDLYRDQIILIEKLRWADKVVTVCEFNKKFIFNLFPIDYPLLKEKIIIYHLGIEFPPRSHEQRNPATIICVGRLDQAKGFHLAIEAFKNLKPEILNLKLIIIGDGPEKDRLVRLVKYYNIDNDVVFAGHLPYSKVEQYMKTATILLHPSTGLGDAVPTVIKEAMANGLPVIGSDAVGIPELLDFGKAGILFHANDILELTFELGCLLRNEKKLMELSATGYEFAKKTFDMKVNGERLLIELGMLSNDH